MRRAALDPRHAGDRPADPGIETRIACSGLFRSWMSQSGPGAVIRFILEVPPRFDKLRQASGMNLNRTTRGHVIYQCHATIAKLSVNGRTARVAAEFVRELARNSKAKQFFSTLNKANLYAIPYRLQTAKRPETKLKRMKLIIEMLARGEKFH
ncbi:MAG: YdeI/OmpD-associated family protein [Sinobacteraceae bacterium]|nr:YdeI/OmpD-associated family protein [Nevskiaceae bacterium]